MQLAVLLRPGGASASSASAWPHWVTIKRLLKIGVPAGVGDLLGWFANIGVIAIVNRGSLTKCDSDACRYDGYSCGEFELSLRYCLRHCGGDDGGDQFGSERSEAGRLISLSGVLPGGGLMTFCDHQ